MDLEHGCRTEYGPLELRIQTTHQLNGYTVFVEDPRQEPACVHEKLVQSTLESAKDYLVLRAGEYLGSHQEAAQHRADWRCS